MENLIYYLIGIAVLGLAYALWKTRKVFLQEEGTQKMKDTSSYISSASLTFIKTEYKVLSVFVVLLGVLLFLQSRSVEDSNIFLVVSFIVGATFSALAGYLSIYASSKTHSRTANDAETSISKAFTTAFSSGSAVGIAYITLAVIGLAGLFLSYQLFGIEWGLTTALNGLTGFALGASTVALFDRIIGGVYAQAADEGKALVLKSEEAIPENTLVNPAEIANNAGINVNNVSGAGSDLFESFVAAIIAAMLLAVPFVNADAIQNHFSFGPVLLPLTIMAIGILSSITGNFLVRTVETESFWTSYRFSTYISAAILATASFFIIKYMLPAEWEVSKSIGNSLMITKYQSLGIFWATFIGIGSGVLLGLFTDYFTISGKPVNSVIEKSFKGYSSNILSGLSTGTLSTFAPVLIIAIAIAGSYYFVGFYGVAIAAVGLLANTGIILAINSYSPITKNADSLAKMSALSAETIQTTSELKEIGNRKVLIVKGFTVSAAALTAFALFGAFIQKTGISLFQISDPLIIGAILTGAMIPFVFSAVVINAVGEVANKILNEVNRQFNEIPQLKAALDIYKKYYGDPNVPNEEEQAVLEDAEGKAEYNDLVILSTYNSVRELIIPLAIAIAIPAIVGYFGGAELLAGLLTGLIPVGFILAISQANSGAVWHSAKKEIAKGVVWNGETYGTHSEVYEIATEGDNVGKPLRNVSAPALNILIKLSTIIALIIASGII
ncbi:MAG: sodium-translocating pyrophosphatase [Bacteroidetes bacterium]|nr:MAG: sodium-translocating pyrophosphatase [Bacteroidota bacterium]